MTFNFGTPVLLACMLALASISGNEPFVGGQQMEAVTKYVNGVPIYNYQFFSEHTQKSSMNEKDATPFTTWMIKVRDEYDQKMRDFCAFSETGKRHCTTVTESFSSLHFNGTQDELTLFLNAYSTIVEFVEPDSEVSIDEVWPDPELPGVMQSNPEWGLDRIDDRKCIGNSYSPGLDGGHGTGIHVYILDTGIRITHADFEGRAVAAFETPRNAKLRTCQPKDKNCAMDRHGHGTHCAGIAGGKRFGVAKNVMLHSGKVLSDDIFKGSGVSGVIQGIDWVVSHGEKPAVISMSLGSEGPRVNSYKVAIDAAFNKGVTSLSSAGNSAVDACQNNPAYVPNLITVGSTSSPTGSNCQDLIAVNSNYGRCVDIWAPGVNIISAGRTCDTCVAAKSGTSMAAPAVAGAVALIYAAYPGVKPSQIKSLLQEHATKIKIVPEMAEYGVTKPNSPPYFLYVGKDWQVEPTAMLAVWKRVPMGCVNGHNIEVHGGETVEQCEIICDATQSCVAFQYGVAYGAADHRWKPGDCSPQSSDDYRGCNGEAHNLDLYVKKAVYKRMPKACVKGHNVDEYEGKTLKECAELCEAEPSCVGFEYGVAYGGRGHFKPGDCSPQNSGNPQGCDGAYFNLDFYIKEGRQSAFEEHQTEEHAATEASTMGVSAVVGVHRSPCRLLQVSMGFIAVVGVIIGVKWHPSAVLTVQVKPLLG